LNINLAYCIEIEPVEKLNMPNIMFELFLFKLIFKLKNITDGK